MSRINPAVTQWIDQMADADQSVAFYAYQCLQEEIFQAGRPAQEAVQTELAEALGQELVATSKTGDVGGPASFRNNAFLAAAASDGPTPRHPAQVRVRLARLLGYIPQPAAVPYLAKAMNDLDVRDMARQSLECNRSDAATDALIAALDSAGAEFCCGAVNSLAKRHDAKVAIALQRAARDHQDDVRIAALYALAEFAEPEHDRVLERAAKAASAGERRVAHVARARLAATLWAAGNHSAAKQIYSAILSSDAPEAQKKACRLALA